MKWYIQALKRYIDFSGRANRKEYWYFVLFNVIFSLTFLMLALFCAAYFLNKGTTFFSNLTILYFVIVFLPSMAVTVRRLHDFGKSGWWYFISFIPFIGGVYMVLLLCQQSDYDNNYGAEPDDDTNLTTKTLTQQNTGIALIIVAALLLLRNIISSSYGIALREGIFSTKDIIWFFVSLLNGVLFLIFAIEFYKNKIKTAAILLIIVAVISLIPTAISQHNSITNFTDFFKDDFWYSILLVLRVLQNWFLPIAMIVFSLALHYKKDNHLFTNFAFKLLLFVAFFGILLYAASCVSGFVVSSMSNIWLIILDRIHLLYPISFLLLSFYFLKQQKEIQ
ncbi:MAG: DUF805 domain-containing protein [Paludibacter sp.]|jgi:uncharacterized membrane protein YhaH (DUF805 family)|nr:DUF805 domain-containing protein [Paludibacter sp.]